MTWLLEFPEGIPVFSCDSARAEPSDDYPIQRSRLVGKLKSRVLMVNAI